LLQQREAAEWALFIGVFMAVAVWETFLPRSKCELPVERRWRNHLLLFAISSVAAGVIFRTGAVALAISAEGNRFGLLNRPWQTSAVRFVLALLALDLVRYGTHRLFHSVPFLWRIHEVHHSDPDYDVSTAGRFHPIELIVDQAVFLAAVILLAPPPMAVFVSQLLTSAENLFAHANAKLGALATRIAGLAFITPEFHRVHHSAEIADQSRNFGQTFSFWDRLFGTFETQRSGVEFATGIKGTRDWRTSGLGFMLRKPFAVSRLRPGLLPAAARSKDKETAGEQRQGSDA
jgi:sterol desaturase/sphingolipid hydroxylase (fatty acid hydroxylase superfamily)